MALANFRNKKALKESSHLFQERHHATISPHCLPKQQDRESNKTAPGSLNPACSQAPRQELRPPHAFTVIYIPWHPREGPPKAPTGGWRQRSQLRRCPRAGCPAGASGRSQPQLPLLGRTPAVPRTFLLLTLTKPSDSKMEKWAVQLLLHGETKRAPGRHFQLSQCCVVAGMRNDLPLLKPLTLRYFLLLRPDGES